MVGENISNLWCSSYRKMYFRVIKAESRLFTHASPGKALPRLSSSCSPLTGRGKILIPPRQHFFKNLFPQQNEGSNL